MTVTEPNAKRVHYRDRYFTLFGDDERAHYLRTEDAAICVPLTDSGYVIFVVEPSPAFEEDVLVLPGGQVGQNEAHAAAANRELQEEIGYRALNLDFLGTLRPYSKYLATSQHLYLARHLVPSKLPGDELYDITSQLVPLDDFERLISTGRLQDSTVIAALYMARDFIRTETQTAD
jgi:8-oxo-dGTP pyrophosphatase MutT (NUDIX family)